MFSHKIMSFFVLYSFLLKIIYNRQFVFFFKFKLFSDRMAETIKEELNKEEFEIKEEIVSIKEEILPSSAVEDTCTINLKKHGKYRNTR